MDTGEMQELLRGYLDEVDWSAGITKEDLVRKLDGRDDALRAVVGEYVADGTYRSPEEVLNVIPAQAWQDVQGDAWRGAEIHDIPGTPTHFGEGRVGQDQSTIHHRADASPPPTPGFGHTDPESEGTGGPSA